MKRDLTEMQQKQRGRGQDPSSGNYVEEKESSNGMSIRTNIQFKSKKN